MKNNMSVIAVVVTYNRLSLLKRCLIALINQSETPDAIVVVNNGSSDGTEDWLKTWNQSTPLIVINQQNLGSAGGQFVGISKAFDLGASWIWCMDDDGVPDNYALENLMLYKDKAPCMMNSLVIDIENDNKLVFPINGKIERNSIKQKLTYDITHLFNGTLIHREIVEKVGLPIKELFIWGEESEYFFRIKRSFSVFTVSESIHRHPANNFNLFQNWNNASLFKMYFYFRNRLFINRSRFNNMAEAYFRYIIFIIILFFIILFFQQNKINKLKLLSKAFKDAYSLLLKLKQ